MLVSESKKKNKTQKTKKKKKKKRKKKKKKIPKRAGTSVISGVVYKMDRFLGNYRKALWPLFKMQFFISLQKKEITTYHRPTYTFGNKIRTVVAKYSSLFLWLLEKLRCHY